MPLSKLELKLNRRVAKAVTAFRLIEDGDRIMVALSGGKDSHAMLHLLHAMRARVPIDFELIAVHLDQAQPGYDGRSLVDYLEARGYAYRIIRADTYSIVREKTKPGQAYCFLCSRLRRGLLYRAALDLGCNKIALGHHREDALETLLLNLIFSGQLKTMPAWLTSDDGRNTVIRPLIYCEESDLARLADEKAFPILPCNLCGSQEKLQRREVRKVLDEIEARWPGASARMLAGLGHVRPSHLLDPGLWARLGMGPKAAPPPRCVGDDASETSDKTHRISYEVQMDSSLSTTAIFDFDEAGEVDRNALDNGDVSPLTQTDSSLIDV